MNSHSKNSRLIKNLLKISDKTSSTIKRDIEEISHLQTSRNLKNFLKNSQSRLEKTILEQFVALYEGCGFITCSEDGKIATNSNASEQQCMLLGIDGMSNFSRGSVEFGFGVLLLEKDEIVASAICLPGFNKVIYLENNSEYVFIINEGGVDKRLIINNTMNISIPNIVAATNDIKNIDNNIKTYLSKRHHTILMSSSILYDFVKLLENKIDLLVMNIPSSYYCQIIEFFIEIAGGATIKKDDLLIVGKQSIIAGIK